MAHASVGRQCVRFGVFEVDLDSGELRKHGIRIKLQQKPFQILGLLLEHPGEVVTREELQRRLWASDVFVDFESGLNNAVKKLRAALGDSAETPRFIETVAGRGYRFLAIPQAAQNLAAVIPPVPARIYQRWGVAALAIILELIGFIWAARRNTVQPAASASQTHKIAVLPLENLSHDEQQE